MAAISGITGAVTFSSGYTSNCYKWEIESTAEDLDVTPFSPSSSYATAITGLLRWRGTYECYIDGTTALPLAGVTGAATFAAVSGKTYSGNINVTSVRGGVSADGGSRTLTIGFTGNGPCAGA